MTDDLVTRAKMVISGNIKPTVILSQDEAWAMIARIEQQAATIARLEGDRDAVATARDTMGNLWAQEKGRAEAAEAKVAALVEALRLMRSTYPYNPPCYGWVEQVEAHKTAKAALAAAKAVMK